MAMAVTAVGTILPAQVYATERHFTYTYETGVLPAGGRELEQWVTARVGREHYYSRIDTRTEYEIGLTDRLQGALYLNAKSISREDSQGEKESTFEFAGVSLEVKYKLLDPVAHPVGLGFYGEVTASADELEQEVKVLIDKRVGVVLLAANLVAENEWEFGPGAPERTFELKAFGGIAYVLRSRASIGIELMNSNKFPDGQGLEHSALFLGPVLSYAAERWWLAFTLLAQLPALKGSQPGDSRILSDHEKINGRLLFGLHF